MTPLNRTLSVAPMMDWTDRHCRMLHRILAPDALLYSEMVTTGALLHADPARFLAYNAAEHPLALQLGGSNPNDLAKCARMAEAWGYDEVNLNCGCPSDRVQNGGFGACLMAEPALVAECIAAMRSVVTIPVTVKCRIGIDDSAEWDFLADFIDKIHATGCDVFIIHARKAWLNGLSPKENRTKPPLRYDIAERVKQTWPNLSVTLNGGLTTLAQIQSALPAFDGVMIGREAYQNPWFLAECQQALFGGNAPASPHAALLQWREYLVRELENGTALRAMTRHCLGMFQGMKGARNFRRILSEQPPDSDIEIFDAALAAIESRL